MSHNKAKRDAKARQAETGESYVRARRIVTSKSADADPHERERKIRTRMAASRLPMAYAAAAILVDREAQGLPAAPDGWRSAVPHMASTYRANDVRAIEILDAATDRVVAKVTVPYQDPDELEAGYREDMAAGPHSDGHVSGYDLPAVRLGRPDLIVHQLGWESLADWSEWPDGTWRCAARPFGRRHTVRAAPLTPHQLTIGTVTVWEYPGGRVVADEIIEPVNRHDSKALNAALDKLGYTVDRWEVLPGRVRYGAALPGHLAERDWSRRARVRIVKETTVGAVDPRVDRTFKAGEELVMEQRGRAGEEVLRDNWWTSSDIDGAHIISTECAEIVEILNDVPPTWDEAALSASQVAALLAPHHPGAAEAAAAWESAGLHVSWWARGLAIRTPAPEYRMVGRVPGDYWKGGALSRPYEAIAGEDLYQRERKLDRLPLDPVAAAVRVIDCHDLWDAIGTHMSDGDLIRNGIWERASQYDRDETGPREHWDYDAIEASWIIYVCDRLSTQAVIWDPAEFRGDGSLTVPADWSDERVASLWAEAYGWFDNWVDGIISKVREGRQLAPEDDVRPWTAPGREWVRYADPGDD